MSPLRLLFLRRVEVSKWRPMSINDIHLFSVLKDLFHCPCGACPPSTAVGVVI